MVAPVRLVVVGLIVLTVVHLSVAWFLRSTRRERLEREWDAANPGGTPEARKAAVEEGVAAFRESLVYRALWLIYVLPATFVVVVLAVTNWN